MGQTSDPISAPFPMCQKTDYFSDLGHCFDPMSGDQIEFGVLLLEILSVTAVALAFWACTMVYGYLTTIRSSRRRPATPPSGENSGVGGSGGGELNVAYEEVPLERLGGDPSSRIAAEGETPAAAGEEEATCRICKDEEGPFIAPCKCRGSSAYVHPECLQKWVETKTQSAGESEDGELHLTCEICLEAYDVAVERHFACDQERLCSPESWREYCNCLLLCCLLPLIFVAMWLSCNAEEGESLIRGEGLCREEGHWTIVAIGVLLLLTFIATMQKVFLRWWYFNHDVKLTGAAVHP